MQTSLLLKISLITSIIGLILLFYLAENLEPKLIEIKEIDERLFEEYVKISGEISKVRETEGLYILTVNDGEEIDVIIFKNKEKLSFTKNSRVEVIGKVSEFRGKLQIEAFEIRKNVS